MESYTAEEIRRAYIVLGRLDSVGEKLIGKLHELKTDHSHDWADDDMISAKEIRAAWGRTFAGRDGGVFAGSASSACEKFLQDISEHREPEYPVNTVWQAANNVIWLRVSDFGGRWAKFGSVGIYPHNAPERPLRQMT
jgi:hypothetical protein